MGAHSTFQQGVFYYGWHHDNFHHNQGYLRDKLQKADGTPSKQFPAIPGYTRGEYDDLNGTVVKKQIQAMLKCGITFMVCSWWGPDSAGDPGLEDRQFDDYVRPQCGEYNVNQRKEVMRACLLYETTRIKQNGRYVYNTNASNQLRNEMAYIKDKYTHPTRNDNKYYLRASKRFSNTTTADSPVLFFYLLRAYSENDQKAILNDIYEIFTNDDYSGYSVEPYIIGDLMFDNPKSYDTDIQRKLGLWVAMMFTDRQVGKRKALFLKTSLGLCIRNFGLMPSVINYVIWYQLYHLVTMTEVLGLMLITVLCHARFLIGNLAVHTRRISDLPKRVLCLYRVARLIQW